MWIVHVACRLNENLLGVPGRTLRVRMDENEARNCENGVERPRKIHRELMAGVLYRTKE